MHKTSTTDVAVDTCKPFINKIVNRPPYAQDTHWSNNEQLSATYEVKAHGVGCVGQATIKSEAHRTRHFLTF